MWIKICGIRDVATARAVADCRPDAIGLNFYARSPRLVSPDVAAEIVRGLPAGIEAVGVFVNHSAAEIQALCERCGISTVQLHGDEPPETLAALRGLKVIRAFRMGAEGLAPLARYLERCRELEINPIACLIDSHVDGVYGGSGKPVAWESLQQQYARSDWPPLILAGGLGPANVREGVETVRPWGVDVASGVETTPGVKDIGLVREFINRARGE